MRKWEMIIYGIENCGYCTELKEGLKKIDIPFIYINISNNEELGDKIEEIYKCPVYPIISLKYPQQITGYRDWETDRKSTRLNSSHSAKSRMPSSA